MPDFHAILSPSFWFDIAPSPLSQVSVGILFGVFAAILVAGIVLRVLRANKKTNDRFTAEILRRASKLGITMGFLGLVLFFFSYEQIHLFGSKFWYLIWLVGAIVWIVWILVYALRTAPAMRAAAKERQEIEKYLPKSKKRK